MKTALEQLILRTPHFQDCSQMTESERTIACSCGLTQLLITVRNEIASLPVRIAVAAVDMRNRAALECDRHAAFCKKEADGGGNHEHLLTRKAEAEYNAERIRSLPLSCIGNDSSCPCQDGDLCHYRGNNPWPLPILSNVIESK